MLSLTEHLEVLLKALADAVKTVRCSSVFICPVYAMRLCCVFTLTATVQLALLFMWSGSCMYNAAASFCCLECPFPLYLYFRVLRVSWQQGLLIQAGMSQVAANMKYCGRVHVKLVLTTDYKTVIWMA